MPANVAEGAPERHSRAWAASLILHAIGAAVLMTVRITEQPPPAGAGPHFASTPLFLRRASTPTPPVPMRARKILARRAPATPPGEPPKARAKKFLPPKTRVADLRPTPLLQNSPIPESLVPEASAPLASPPAMPKLAVAPAPPLKTDNFGGAEAIPRTTAHARVFAQPAGFGTPDSTSPPARGRGPVAAGGFDRAEAEHGSRSHGQVTAGNFETAMAGADPVSRRAAIKLAQAGFGDAEVGTGTEVHRQKNQHAIQTAVEILAKPRPVYTVEARNLGIEGEVLIEAIFPAAGDVHVVRVVRGLGHGLDEAATDAVRQIRFHPATRGGEPINSTALVHIQFQLAY